MQFQFQRIEEHLMEEQAAENDHEEGTQDHRIGMKVNEPLDKDHIGQYGQGIKNNELAGQFLIGLGLESSVENISVENEFQRGADIIKPGIVLM